MKTEMFHSLPGLIQQYYKGLATVKLDDITVFHYSPNIVIIRHKTGRRDNWVLGAETWTLLQENINA